MKKKLMYLVNTDDARKLDKFKRELEEGIVIIPANCFEVWEIDENNNCRRII